MTTLLRDGQSVEDPRLDRIVSATTEHLEKYPLTAATMPAKETAVVMGVNWYRNFDSPVARRIRGHYYYVIGDGDLGRVRGGHCTALKPYSVSDPMSWWIYYNQGDEGRCVEFGVSRMLSLANRKRYDITSRWLYWSAQRADEWPGGSYPGATPQYEGTSVRAGLDVVQKLGAVPAPRGGRPVSFAEAEREVSAADGIAAYRWATNWDDVRTVLGVPDWLPGVPMLNSWGRDYPHQVLLLDQAGSRLLAEDGEFGVVVDR